MSVLIIEPHREILLKLESRSERVKPGLVAKIELYVEKRFLISELENVNYLGVYCPFEWNRLRGWLKSHEEAERRGEVH